MEEAIRYVVDFFPFLKFDVQLEILSNCNSLCFKDELEISKDFQEPTIDDFLPFIIKRAIWLDLPKKISEVCAVVKISIL